MPTRCRSTPGPASSARRSRCPISTTCTSPPTASRRSWWPRRCGGSSSAIRTRWSCKATSTRRNAPGSTTPISPPTARYAIFTCEFNNALAKIDLVHHKLVETLPLTPGHMPPGHPHRPRGQDVFRRRPFGATALVVIDGDAFGQTGFIKTGVGARGPLSCEPRAAARPDYDRSNPDVAAKAER